VFGTAFVVRKARGFGLGGGPVGLRVARLRARKPALVVELLIVNKLEDRAA